MPRDSPRPERDDRRDAGFRLDWPERAESERTPGARRSELRLPWAADAGESASDAPAPATEPEQPSRQVGPGRLRVRTRRSDAGSEREERSDTAVGPHAPCRSEIERLEAQVAALQAEIAALKSQP